MYDEIEKLSKAKEILEKIASGIDPTNGGNIAKGSFVFDENINANLLYAIQKLRKLIAWEQNRGLKSALEFIISKEEKEKIKLPNKKIGINEFAKCVNEAIDTNLSKKISGVEINKKLKQMGILGEEKDGKISRTIVNENSKEYGIEIEKRKFKDSEYEAIVFNEEGKKFLLDNLEKIMDHSA